MFPNFKETIASLKNTSYGSTIIAHPLNQVIHYFLRYFLWVWLIMFLLSASAAAYLIPQFPKFATQLLPKGTISIANGQFSTDLPQPYIIGDNRLAIILDESGDAASLSAYTTGALINQSSIIFKDDTGALDTRALPSLASDFSITRDQVVAFLDSHQPQIAAVFAGLFLIFVLLSFVGQVIGFLFWSLVVWLAAKIMSRSLSFASALKLVIYASILPFVISILLRVLPSAALSWLSLIILLFYSISWLYHLPKKNASSV